MCFSTKAQLIRVASCYVIQSVQPIISDQRLSIRDKVLHYHRTGNEMLTVNLNKSGGLHSRMNSFLHYKKIERVNGQKRACLSICVVWHMTQ